MSYIKVVRLSEGYDFFHVFDDGTCWELGHAWEAGRDKFAGEEWTSYEGLLDTRGVWFDDEEGLLDVLRRRFPDDDYMFAENVDGVEEWEFRY